MIKVKYRKDLEPDFIKDKRNVLSFNLKTKGDNLPLLVISWGMIWLLIKHMIKGRTIYFCSHSSLEQDIVYYDFFRLKR